MPGPGAAPTTRCVEVMNAIGTRDATRCLCTAFTEDRHTSVEVFLAFHILKLACLLGYSLLFTAFSASCSRHSLLSSRLQSLVVAVGCMRLGG